MDDFLIWCHRKVGPVARRLGVQRVARRIYEEIAAMRYPQGALVTARLNGRSWKLRRDIAERGELREFDTFSWLRQTIRPGMTVIDVGANVGQMTLEMGMLVGEAGRVIAIEPATENLDYLRQHLKGNNLSDRVSVVEAACAEQDGGTVTFFVATPDGVSSLGNGHNIIGLAPIRKQDQNLKVLEKTVPRISIDGLCKRLGLEPAAIKIDVEGAEILVLQGAKETLRQFRPNLRVAFHPFAFEDPVAASTELLVLVEQAGYRLVDGPRSGEALDLAEYNLIPV